MEAPEPRTVRLRWPKIYRIVPTKFPPINFFERIVAPEQMEAAWYLESLTNDRLRDETGDITLVPKTERVSGPGASVVMAAFTHIGLPSRFQRRELRRVLRGAFPGDFGARNRLSSRSIS